MSSLITKQKSILAVAITSVLGAWSGHVCSADLGPITDLTESVTINQGDRVYSASGSAIDITSGGDSKYDITNNGIVQSDSAAAIRITGAKAGDIVNYGQVIGGMVNGEQIALDTRGSENGIAYVMQGGSETSGNLYLNPDKYGSEIAVKGSTAAIFDAVLVSGAREFKVGQESTLTLRPQNESIVMDMQADGKVRLSNKSTLNIELNGELADDEAALKVNGGFELDTGASADLVVRGNVQDVAGTQRLIEADSITGYGDLEVTGGWLLTVDSHQLLTNADGDQYIEAEISYNGEASAEDLAQMAIAGGADTTESQVLESFGNIALGGTEISSDVITFTSENSEELANLLNGVSNDQEAARLAGELTPDRSGAIIHAIHRSQNHQLDHIDKRLSVYRNGQEGGFWLNMYGYQGEKDVNGRIDGYEVSGLSASFGMDKNYSENMIVGAAFSINRQDIDTQIYSTNYIVDDYQMSLYGSLNKDQYFTTLVVNAGYSSFVSARTVGENIGYSGNTKAEGDFSAMNIALRMNSGVNYEFGRFSVQPLVAAELNHLKISDYEETGSIASLSYDDQSVSQIKLGGGLNVSTKIELDSATLSPSLMVMGWYDFNADDEQIDAYVLADETTQLDIDTVSGASKERYELQAALDYHMSRKGKLGVALGHQVEHDYIDTKLQLQYQYSF
ncbi:autotransporter family protein [Endozoicomonas elysicola]|uniref:Autotransporter domain-containing protein n=2 Tax=Endozoicomonas elysicola TaxID=305900 RepID=A0A081K585_9GAMM|nr:autotransporter outer membrane beta-barrel domain-containing protein [Endozoicomonas elysicola]KEI69311.1 hypothetical protein GV64_24495 [Endozoicomonas elysicola]